MTKMRACAGILFLCGFMPLYPQDSIDSRAAEIEAMREKKARELAPDETTKAERVLIEIKEKKLIERFTEGIAGFRIKLGGLATGQGFALGPEYLRRDIANGQVQFRSSGRVSFSGAQLYDMQLTAPQLREGLFFTDLYTAYQNLPRMNYYGPGPDSNKNGRTDYRFEQTSFDASAGVNPIRSLRIGGRAGYLLTNVGRGNDRRLAKAEDLYLPSVAPGIQEQTDFFRTSAFVQWDTRDNPGGPRRGGNYSATWSHFSDRALGRYSFRRWDLDAQQYIPFFNERRVIALHARTVFSDPRPGQVVPFYLQPVLGGSETNRGFRPYRFYDNNMMAYTAEYRWESFSGLDMAIFADAGKVFPRQGDFDLKDLETSVGFGFRFNVRNNVFLRVDVGFSHEGYQLWLKFNNVF